MRITIHQPESRTGVPEENLRALIDTARGVAEESDVVFAPLGSVEGGLLALQDEVSFQSEARARYTELLLDEAARMLLRRPVMLAVPVRFPEGIRHAVLNEGRVTFADPAEGILLPDGTRVALREEAPGDIYWNSSLRHTVWEELPLPVSPSRPVLSMSLGGAERTEIFRGESFFTDGIKAVALPRFERARVTFEWRRGEALDGPEAVLTASLRADREAVLYEALVKSVRSYVARSFLSGGVVLGISGGVDSALCAAAAVDALGPDRVCGVLLASRYTSEESRSLARALCNGLGIELRERSIESLHDLAVKEFELDVGALSEGDITDQNIQARLRCFWLMAIANRRNALMLCSSNKAEAAMGYGTLYGDIAGGFAPIADLWKADVRRLCYESNRRAGAERIPVALIEREPTAELRSGQKDSDSLPPYETIEAVMERVFAGEQLERKDAELAARAARFAFKRQQSPCGLRLSPVTLADWDRARGF